MSTNKDQLVTGPFGSNACYEQVITVKEHKEPIKTWLCFGSGYTTSTLMTEGSKTVTDLLETAPELYKALMHKDDKGRIEVNKKFKPTVLVGIMRGAAPIIDILSRIFKLPTAYIVIQSYSGKGLEDKQGDLIFARDISSIAQQKDFERVLLVDDLSDTGLTLNRSIDWLKSYDCLLYTSPSPRDY